MSEKNTLSIPFFKTGLTNNQLKIIAMLAMACDHVAKILFPKVIILQIIGRLAFPIFAYMIAEGCKHTKNKRKYILQIMGLGIICQIVFTIVMRSLYQNIFITFTLSIITIFAIERFVKKSNVKNFIIMLTVAFIALFWGCLLFNVKAFSDYLYQVTGIKDYYIDYGFLGVLFPIVIYFAPNKWLKLASAVLMILIYGFHYNPLQFYMLLAIPHLALYNGKRGKANLKYMFYLFYPAHLAIIYGVNILINWQYYF